MILRGKDVMTRAELRTELIRFNALAVAKLLIAPVRVTDGL